MNAPDLVAVLTRVGSGTLPYPDDRLAVVNVRQNDSVCPDSDVVANGDGTKDLGSRADPDSVAQSWLPGSASVVPDGDTLVDHQVPPGYDFMTNDGAQPVDECEAGADVCRGMHLDRSRADCSSLQ